MIGLNSFQAMNDLLMPPCQALFCVSIDFGALLRYHLLAFFYLSCHIDSVSCLVFQRRFGYHYYYGRILSPNQEVHKPRYLYRPLDVAAKMSSAEEVKFG